MGVTWSSLHKYHGYYLHRICFLRKSAHRQVVMYILSHLPSSLIVSAFLSLCFNLHFGASSAELVARAAPVETPEILELSPDTFKQTISDGYWFIEHYSPSCHHCRKFAPTWKILVHDALSEIPHVKLATVNCAMYGG